MRTRTWLALGALVGIGAVLGLMGWALARTGGQPGGLVVNTQPGLVPVPFREAPDFTLPLLDGGTFRLSDHRGRVALVDFWASWCVPCRREAPDLARLWTEEYEGTEVVFVGIAIWDSEEAVRAYREEFGLRFPIGMDDTGRIAIDYGVTGIPEKYLIDAEGRVALKYIGPTQPDTLRRLIEEVRRSKE